jgi:hypothetical protein
MHLPHHAHEYSADLLTRIVSVQRPDIVITALTVVEGRQYGDGNASTAGRCVFDVDYAPGTNPALPRRLVVKIARIGASADHHVLYRNELNFYQRLRPSLDIEAPLSLGSHFDEDSGTFALVMEDLALRSGRCMNNLVDHSPEHVRQLLDVLAPLHARFWNSPRFEQDLAWVPAHTHGPLHTIFSDPDRVPAHVAATVPTVPFKREMLQRLGVSPADLYQQVRRAQRAQRRGPLTLLHGDCHVGNTYRLPDGAGLIDWQLLAHGHYMHDVGYYIQTSLCVADRRRHERELIGYYLDRLQQAGVTAPPSLDDAWQHYRRTCAWNLYIGWLPVGIENYGWEICELAHLRVTTAYEDLQAARAIAGLD